MADQIRVRLQPKQSELYGLWSGSEYRRLGFGGARGGAKSGGGRRGILLRRLEYAQTPGLLLRRTQRKLHESHITKLFEEFPALREYWGEQKKELKFPNGSRLVFGSAENPGDMSNFYSAEYADILVDEAQEFSQGELEELGGSNRCTTNEQITPKIVYSFMPGVSDSGVPPKGLPYLKRVFVDGELRKEEKRLKWAFIQAFSWDNIEWARKELKQDGVSEEQFYSWSETQRRDYYLTRTEYGANLASLTNKGLRDAWLYGKWDVFEGQYFPNFSYETHTVDANEIVIEPWHRRWISLDWGFNHPTCVHWHTDDEHGRVTTYREEHVREMSMDKLGELIVERTGNERIVDFIMSWDAFGKLDPKTRKSLTQLLATHLPSNIAPPRPCDSSPGSRISGWRLMYEMLDAKNWRISRDCSKLIECLPTLVRDMERNSEDVLKVDWSENYVGDDPADSARYGLQNMCLPKAKPWSVVHQEVITAAIGNPEQPNYQNAFMKDMEMRETRNKQMSSANTRSKSLAGRRRYI